MMAGLGILDGLAVGLVLAVVHWLAERTWRTAR
jgi:tetrahydromethanopterin S-methyltransferase subunit G